MSQLEVKSLKIVSSDGLTNDTFIKGDILKSSGGSISGSLISSKPEILTTSGSRFNINKTSVGNFHIVEPVQGASPTSCKIHGTTFATPFGETQAGIVFSENSSDGTAVGIYTTDSYAEGPRLGVSVDPWGRVSTPRQPAFEVHHDSVVGPGIWVGTDVKYNIGSHYNSSNGRFTAPISGVYIFSMTWLSRQYIEMTNVYIIKNGTLDSASVRTRGQGASNHITTTGVAQYYLNAGDFVSIYIDGYIYGDGQGWTSFIGHFVG